MYDLLLPLTVTVNVSAPAESSVPENENLLICAKAGGTESRKLLFNVEMFSLYVPATSPDLSITPVVLDSNVMGLLNSVLFAY